MFVGKYPHVPITRGRLQAKGNGMDVFCSVLDFVGASGSKM
jgi:hypothetical protein